VEQDVTLPASAVEVFDALLDSTRHSTFTGARAEIDRRPGGKFSLYDGHLIGTILEIEPNRRIVEEWRATDWPDGAWSRVEFRITALEEGRGCLLSLVQSGVPAERFDNISAGWQKYYWAKLADYFRDR